MQIVSHSLLLEQAKFDLVANIRRNDAATALGLGCRITTGTPFWPHNVYRNGVPVHSGTSTPPRSCAIPIDSFDQYWYFISYNKRS